MSEAIQLVPNKWVSEEVLIAITGLTKNAIKSAWEKSWMEDREYRHYSGDCQPKDNSPILYNRHEVDNWVERQRPASNQFVMQSNGLIQLCRTVPSVAKPLSVRLSTP
ncbi:excisionase family protein [Kosakonia cowanii]|uniref:excisionase family protein n=1 Tax=Kosakonia cowanii TaxID=208223 RepID=UPI00320B14E1